MNDFDYDNLQRKRLAQNARYKKNGCKSRKCTLPQDYMTPAQLKRRNSEVSTWNLNAPMKWNTFIKMPDDLKQEYIELLREVYNASNTAIAKMLGKPRPVVVSEIKRIEMLDGLQRRMNRAQEETWEEFINPKMELEVKSVAPETVEVLVPAEPESAKHNEELAIAILDKLTSRTKTTAAINSGRLNFVGSIESIAEKLTAFLGEGEYSVVVDFRAVSEKEETDELF